MTAMDGACLDALAYWRADLSCTHWSSEDVRDGVPMRNRPQTMQMDREG